jgi:hypothetical protein
MNDSQVRVLDASQRVRAVAAARSTDFPAASRQAELVSLLDTAIKQVEELAAKQISAILDGQKSVEQKKAAIKSLLALLRAINQTARSINEQFPGLADQFKMPRDIEQDILNRARAFITNATPIATEFTTRCLPATFPADLQAAIEAVEAAGTHKANALAAQTAATAGLAAAIKRLLSIQRELNAIMRNLYSQDPASLAAWTTASHIQRAPKRATKKASKKATELIAATDPPESPTPPTTAS